MQRGKFAFYFIFVNFISPITNMFPSGPNCIFVHFRERVVRGLKAVRNELWVLYFEQLKARHIYTCTQAHTPIQASVVVAVVVVVVFFNILGFSMHKFPCNLLLNVHHGNCYKCDRLTTPVISSYSYFCVLFHWCDNKGILFLTNSGQCSGYFVGRLTVCCSDILSKD